MERPADFSLRDGAETPTWVLTGDWTAVLMGEANERLEVELAGKRQVTLDMTGVGRFDTSGAYGVLKAAARAQAPRFVARPEVTRLLELVDNATKAEPTPAPPAPGVMDIFDRIGRGMIHLGLEAFDTMVFIGHLLVAVGRACAYLVYAGLHLVGLGALW